jgi:hypothetical protein
MGKGKASERSEWNKPGEDNKPPDNLMKKLVLSQAPTYFFASLLFIRVAGLSQEGGARYWAYIAGGFILLVWSFVLCVDAWRGQRVFRKVAQAMEGWYWIISVLVFGAGLVTDLAAVLGTGMGSLYFYIFYFAGLVLLILLLIHFIQSAKPNE